MKTLITLSLYLIGFSAIFDSKYIDRNQEDFINPSDFNVSKNMLFSLQKWNYGERQEKLVKLTKEEIKKFFQNSELKNDLKYDPSNYYYFSIENIEPRNIRITIIEEYGYCCADLLLLTYNEQHRLIGKSKIAGTGGDGGWGYDEYGTFLNDSLYQLTRVAEETIRDDQDLMEYKIDSVLSRYSVDKNFNFEKIDEKKFERFKVVVNK